MSNYKSNEISGLLNLIGWSGAEWHPITFKMIEGGNQVLEKTVDYYHTSPPKSEVKERRICGNLESEELAQFIAKAPSMLSSATTEIDNLERKIDKMTLDHDRKVDQLDTRIVRLKESLGGMENGRDHYMKLTGELRKKLARYEKKRKKKGGKK